MNAPARQPAGTPVGGQFAPTDRAEADVDLTAPAEGPVENTGDGIVVGGDGYASHEDCDPDDAIPGFFPDVDEDCWICGEEL